MISHNYFLKLLVWGGVPLLPHAQPPPASHLPQSQSPREGLGLLCGPLAKLLLPSLT